MTHRIDIDGIRSNLYELKGQWNDPAKPFRYLVFEDFFKLVEADNILSAYPNVFETDWNGTTYINQKNKFTKTKFGPGQEILEQVFKELNSPEFLNLLTEITGIHDLIPDEKLFGGGLHQSTTGAFLDVHVDFNFHPETKTHRRLNLIVYMNKDWKPEYNGNLELWDMSTKTQIADVAPLFNRFVIFETNEVSFHGHPKKLKTPHGVSRKSIAVYYYTKERDDIVAATDHNTIYVNTEGVSGKVKNFASGMKALKERLFRK